MAASAGVLSVPAAAFRIVSAALDRPGRAREHADGSVPGWPVAQAEAGAAALITRSAFSAASRSNRSDGSLIPPARRRRAIHWPRALLHDMGELVG